MPSLAEISERQKKLRPMDSEGSGEIPQISEDAKDVAKEHLEQATNAPVDDKTLMGSKQILEGAEKVSSQGVDPQKVEPVKLKEIGSGEPNTSSPEQLSNEHKVALALLAALPTIGGYAIGGLQGGAIGGQVGANAVKEVQASEKDLRDYLLKKEEKDKELAIKQNEVDAKKIEHAAGSSKDKNDLTFKVQRAYEDHPTSKLTAQAAGGIQGVRSAAKNPSAADDVALIYAYMKILDPSSVVREGEFAVAQKNTSLLEKFGIAKAQIENGQYALTAPVRKRVVDAAEKQWAGRLRNQNLVDETYKFQAEKYGIEPSSILQNWNASPRVLSAEDKEALKWADANPDDERAKQIKEGLGR